MNTEAMLTYHFNILLTAETPCQPRAEPDECDNTTGSYSAILCDNTTRGCGANLSRYKIPLIPIAKRKSEFRFLDTVLLKSHVGDGSIRVKFLLLSR